MNRRECGRGIGRANHGCRTSDGHTQPQATDRVIANGPDEEMALTEASRRIEGDKEIRKVLVGHDQRDD